MVKSPVDVAFDSPTAPLHRLHPSVVSDLRAAIRTARLATWWQPIVSIQSSGSELLGHEILTRVSHPWFRDPGHFFDLVGEQGMTREISAHLFARIAWLLAEVEDAVLFVNCQPEDLASLEEDEMFPYERCRASASRLVLELAERSKLIHRADMRDRLDRLRQLGFRLAIDDLGAGYATLGLLAKLEPDIVKLDMGLIRGIHERRSQRVIVAHLIQIAHDLGIKVVAEGIELEAELQCLQELGCHFGQGYLMSRPVPSPAEAP